MSKILKVVTIVVLTTAFIIWIYPRFIAMANACERPITYSIGSFDKRFNISEQSFIDALSEAEVIWEDSVDKELFIYEPEKGELVVNLIYDHRQEVTSALSGIENIVEEDESHYNLLQSRYVKLKADYNTAKGFYNAAVETFNNKSLAYENKVSTWNQGRRNSKEEFERLEAERMSLEKEADKLKVLETGLNKIVDEINTLVANLNHLAESLNLNVERFNTIGATRGETFTGGLYTSADGQESIDIYEFGSHDKLVRVLSHELGHALGLEHSDDPKGIMYYLNEGERGVLAETDLAAIRSLCYNESR